MVRSTISSTQWSEAPFLLLNGQKHHFFYSMVRSTISSTQWSEAPFLLLNGQEHHFFYSMVRSTISSTQWSEAFVFSAVSLVFLHMAKICHTFLLSVCRIGL